MGKRLIKGEAVITGLLCLLAVFGLVRLAVAGGSLWGIISIVLCITALVFLLAFRNRKNTDMIGIAAVIVVAVVTVTLFATGEIERKRRLRVNEFKGRDIVARVDGKTYKWSGDAAFGDQDLEYIWNGSMSVTVGVYDEPDVEEETFDVELTIDGVPSDLQLMKHPADDTVYVDINDAKGGIYLILK